MGMGGRSQPMKGLGGPGRGLGTGEPREDCERGRGADLQFDRCPLAAWPGAGSRGGFGGDWVLGW